MVWLEGSIFPIFSVLKKKIMLDHFFFCVARDMPTGEFFERNLPFCIIAEAVKMEMETVASHIQVTSAYSTPVL